MDKIEMGITLSGISVSAWKWIIGIITVCCTLLGLNELLVVAWLSLVVLSTIMGMWKHHTLDTFSWDGALDGFMKKFLVFIIIIGGAILGHMSKQLDTMVYLGDGIFFLINGLIIVFAMKDFYSLLSSYRVIEGKPPLEDIDVIGILGSRFKKVYEAILSGKKKDDR